MTDIEEDSQQPLIPCLYGSVQLQAECEAQGFKLGEDTRKFLVYGMLKALGPTQSQKLICKFVSEGLVSWEEEMYEVESVLDHFTESESGQNYFLIKWHGWSHQHNTWEPRSNLECSELIDEYLKSAKRNMKRKNMSLMRPEGNMKKHRIDEIFDKLVSSKVMQTMTPMEMINFCSPIKKKAQVKGLISAKGQNIRLPISRRIKKSVRKNSFKTKAYIQSALKEWETDVNARIKGFDQAPITIINEVDLEGPPDNFIFINSCKEGPGVTIPKDPLIGCECEDCYECRHACCASDSGSKFAYSKAGRLRLPQGTPVYECNSRCKCDQDCVNRVVQRGRKVKICIFRTSNGRGWGVKSLQKIKKGTFVMEYVGEVISHEEAERRGREYDAAGRTYLFDLDFTDTDAPFTVDAGKYGNAAHFINHSCDPNLEVFCVWIDTLDPRLPHICLYAKRDIDKNEEITFDYMCGQPTGTDNDNAVNTSSSDDKSSDQNMNGSSAVSSPERSPVKAHTVSPAINGLSPTHDTNSDVDTPLALASAPESPRKEGGIGGGKLSNYSMVCQCGAAKCRKYLF